MKKIKIAFVARTVGLEYDDRIRKECITLSAYADVNIFINFSDNRLEKGITSYGIPFQSFRLKTRDFLPSSKFLIIKAFEFYWVIKNELSEYDLIWAHEEYAFMFPLLLKKNYCIWDLHEIPFHFEKGILKHVFKYIEKKSKKLIHANEYRIDYLKKIGLISNDGKHVYINNFPDYYFVESQLEDEKYADFITWLDGSPYAYVQGISVSRRYPFNTVDSIMRSAGLKGIVVGGIDPDALHHLENKYGVLLYQKVFFRGKVNQLQISKYLRNAEFSIVLYDTHTPNNLFCEPNRLYQSLALGVPVIVGHNKPMKDLVNKYHFGIVLSSDGREANEIVRKISEIRMNLNFYKQNIIENNKRIIWSENTIVKEWLI